MGTIHEIHIGDVVRLRNGMVEKVRAVRSSWTILNPAGSVDLEAGRSIPGDELLGKVDVIEFFGMTETEMLVLKMALRKIRMDRLWSTDEVVIQKDGYRMDILTVSEIREMIRTDWFRRSVPIQVEQIQGLALKLEEVLMANGRDRFGRRVR